MLRSKWQQLFWTACTPHFEEGEPINVAVFDQSKYPALAKLDDLYPVEIIMLAYAIMLADTVSDDFAEEPLTGELLFSEMTEMGNVELGINALIKKGWLVGDLNDNWMENSYEVNLRRLVEEGLLTSCERPETGEEVLVPVEFPSYSSFGAEQPFLKTWRSFCNYVYWYSAKRYEWVVYKNLQVLCDFFNNRWGLSWPELRMLALISHKGIRASFTEESIMDMLPDDMDCTEQRHFESLVRKKLVHCTGFNEDGEYLFMLAPNFCEELCRQRIHFDEATLSFSLHASAMTLNQWHNLYRTALELISTGNVESIHEKEMWRTYPALRYMKKLSVYPILLLSYGIITEGPMDKKGCKFLDINDIQTLFLDIAANTEDPVHFLPVTDPELCMQSLKALEERHWLSLLTSTYGNHRIILWKLKALEADALLCA